MNLSRESAPGPVRPRPAPSPRTAGFWDAAKRGVLAVQRCFDCGRFFHPPMPMCMTCHGLNLGFVPVSGLGTVHSVSIMRGSAPSGFESIVPYAVLAVELDEQENLIVMGNLIGAPADRATIGQRVRVVFLREDDGFVLPMFTVVSDDAAPSPIEDSHVGNVPSA